MTGLEVHRKLFDFLTTECGKCSYSDAARVLMSLTIFFMEKLPHDERVLLDTKWMDLVAAMERK